MPEQDFHKIIPSDSSPVKKKISLPLQPQWGCHRPQCHRANIHPEWPPSHAQRSPNVKDHLPPSSEDPRWNFDGQNGKSHETHSKQTVFVDAKRKSRKVVEWKMPKNNDTNDSQNSFVWSYLQRFLWHKKSQLGGTFGRTSCYDLSCLFPTNFMSGATPRHKDLLKWDVLFIRDKWKSNKKHQITTYFAMQHVNAQ